VDNKQSQSDATSIEITAEMVKAGITAWYDYDSRFEAEEDAIRAIFLAMMEANRARA
jgi:hypothetical protein